MKDQRSDLNKILITALRSVCCSGDGHLEHGGKVRFQEAGAPGTWGRAFEASDVMQEGCDCAGVSAPSL